MPGRKVLSRKFFQGQTPGVAEEILGKFLVKREGGRELAYMITEVEAYDGPEDKASHASRGRTPRTEVMFGQGGIFYIYLIYGMYHMLNIVTGDKDYPAAVLIRGVKEIKGPGRLTRDLGIDKSFNQEKVERKTGLWVEDRGVVPEKKEIKTLTRVGVDYAGEEWKNKPLRYLIEV